MVQLRTSTESSELREVRFLSFPVVPSHLPPVPPRFLAPCFSAASSLYARDAQKERFYPDAIRYIHAEVHHHTLCFISILMPHVVIIVTRKSVMAFIFGVIIARLKRGEFSPLVCERRTKRGR